MNHLRQIPNHGKISPGFSARLARSKPRQKLHAIIVLRTSELVDRSRGMRPTQEQRQATIKKVRDSAAEALKDIDDILQRFDGRRLADKPSALGTIPIETTAAGVTALSNSDHVKAILEDQPISRAV